MIKALLFSIGIFATGAFLISGSHAKLSIPEPPNESNYVQSIEQLILPQRKIEDTACSGRKRPSPETETPPLIIGNSEKKPEAKKPEEPFVDDNLSPAPAGMAGGLPGANVQNETGGFGFGQNDSTATAIPDEKPQYPGGENELVKYLRSSVKYKEIEIQNRVQGTIWITFVVSKNGNVRDVLVERGISGGQRLESEAVKAVQRMLQWKPGIKNNKPVSVIYRVPFKFELR